MSRKNPTNLPQRRTQCHGRTLLQIAARLGRHRQRRGLILGRHRRQNGCLAPTRAPITQLDPNGHVFHPVQPRGGDRERGDEGDVQGPPLRSLNVHRERLRQVPEPEARGFCRRWL